MFNKKKNVAIQALNKQKEKLTDEEHYNDWAWIAHTADIVKKYIGENSTLHTAITRFSFGVTSYGHVTNEEARAEFDAKERTAARYIDKCIEYIELNGIKREPKINFLQRLSDKVVWSILIGIGTFGFFLGNLTKSIQIDREKIKLEQQLVQ